MRFFIYNLHVNKKCVIIETLQIITFVAGIIQSTAVQSQKLVKAYFFGGWLAAD